MSDQTPETDQYPRFEAKRQRLERRFSRLEGQSSWVVWLLGLMLILLGGVFFLQNTGMLSIPSFNWWALFIMIPAIAAFERGYRSYRSSGNLLNSQVRGSLFAGMLFTLITLIFLFNLSWVIIGPALIVLVGFAILINNLIR